MDKFLTYIERFKYAILGTVIFHFVVFMTSNFVTVERAYNSKYAVENVSEITLEKDEIEIDEELLEQMLNQQELLTSEQIYNLTSNANDKRERSYENFSSNAIDQQVENDARELEKQYFEEWAKSHPDAGRDEKLNVGENVKDKPTEATKNRNLNTSNNAAGENAFAGRVMVEYDLQGRDDHFLEIPGYTCNGSGTVVVDIKVDKNGDVKSVSYNANKSSRATECMIQNAEKYAKRARFNYKADASGVAEGTITYVFQKK